jgi:hypothetical protein
MNVDDDLPPELVDASRIDDVEQENITKVPITIVTGTISRIIEFPGW